MANNSQNKRTPEHKYSDPNVNTINPFPHVEPIVVINIPTQSINISKDLSNIKKVFLLLKLDLKARKAIGITSSIKA